MINMKRIQKSVSSPKKCNSLICSFFGIVSSRQPASKYPFETLAIQPCKHKKTRLGNQPGSFINGCYPYAFLGAFARIMITVPIRHATPAITNGVSQAEGSAAPLAASLKYPAICGPSIPAIPYAKKTSP